METFFSPTYSCYHCCQPTSPRPLFVGAAISLVISAVAFAIIGAGGAAIGAAAAVVWTIAAVALITTAILLIAAKRFSEDRATSIQVSNRIDPPLLSHPRATPPPSSFPANNIPNRGGIPSNQVVTKAGPDHLTPLPIELHRLIFSMLPARTLDALSLVCRTIGKNVDGIVWETMTRLVFGENVPQPLSDTSWKVYYYNYSFQTRYLNANLKEVKLEVEYTSHFFTKLKEVNPPNFTLLTQAQVHRLFQENDTLQLIRRVNSNRIGNVESSAGYFINQKDPHTLRSVARQDHEDGIAFEIINYTDLVVSFDKDRSLLVNGVRTYEGNPFTKDTCQLIIFFHEDLLYCINRDKGKGIKEKINNYYVELSALADNGSK